MKKIVSVLLALALVFAFSVVSFAADSPKGVSTAKVVINRTSTGSNSETATTVSVKEDGTLQLTPGDSTLKFNGWGIYKDSSKTEAVLNKDFTITSVTLANGKAAVNGTDYKIVNGKVEALDGKVLSISIKALTDKLYVSELFGDVQVKFNTTSPVTGYDYNAGVLAALVMLIMGAGVAALVSRKRALDR